MSSSNVFTSEADSGKQSRVTNTYATRYNFRGFTALRPSQSPRPCQQLSTHADPIFEARFDRVLAEGEEDEDDDMGDAKSVTSTTSSGKRKRNAGPAFYAVRVGRQPGVYYSWADCEAQIKGMKAECGSPLYLFGRAY